MANPPIPLVTIPPTTKAWTYSSRGAPRAVLTLNQSHPVPPFPPTLPADQSSEWLLLRVAYAALNPGDVLGMAVMPVMVRSGPARTAAVPCCKCKSEWFCSLSIHSMLSEDSRENSCS